MEAWQDHHGTDCSDFRTEIKTTVSMGFDRIDAALENVSRERETQHRSNAWKIMSILFTVIGSLVIGLGVLVMFILEHWPHWGHP